MLRLEVSLFSLAGDVLYLKQQVPAESKEQHVLLLWPVQLWEVSTCVLFNKLFGVLWKNHSGIALSRFTGDLAVKFSH